MSDDSAAQKNSPLLGLSTSSTSTAELAEALSFPDGDVILRSSDGHQFKVHTFLLRQASPFFRETLDFLPEEKPNDSVPIVRIDENGKTLDRLLRWLYPQKVQPPISSTTQATSLFRAIENLRIECHPIQTALALYLSNEPHPLRAWALATRFGLPESRRAAARRFMESKADYLDDIPRQLRLVDGYDLMELLSTKRRAIGAAWAFLEQLSGECHVKYDWEPSKDEDQRDGPHWKPLLRERALLHGPFSFEATCELAFELSVERTGCSSCKEHFATAEARPMREEFRANLAGILSSIE